MRFFHLRNKIGDIKATVAYEKDSDTVYYGATIVSSTEYWEDVNKEGGRKYSSPRCVNSRQDKNKNGVQWKTYDNNDGIDMYNYLLELFMNNDIKKLGNLPQEDFYKKVNLLRDTILQMED